MAGRWNPLCTGESRLWVGSAVTCQELSLGLQGPALLGLWSSVSLPLWTLCLHISCPRPCLVSCFSEHWSGREIAGLSLQAAQEGWLGTRISPVRASLAPQGALVSLAKGRGITSQGPHLIFCTREVRPLRDTQANFLEINLKGEQQNDEVPLTEKMPLNIHALFQEE